jgi:signal transduction histidine kinase
MKILSLKIRPENLVLLLVLLVASSGFTFCWLLTEPYRKFSILPFLLLVYSGWQLYQMMRKAQEEVFEFAEAVRYRDFSRNFNVKEAPAEVKSLRAGFNDINSTFQVIRREKETQSQYLNQILELVDIGILSFELETGEQNWMNKAFKRMVDVPYLKNIKGLIPRDESLYEEIISIRPGENRIVTLHANDKNLKILMVASIFQTEGVTNKLLAVQNINTALDENEARAWQKLLSVMTHEIMNSMTPVTSLSATAAALMASADRGDDPAITDAREAIETVARRAEGVMHFVRTYRQLTRPPELRRQSVKLAPLFGELQRLFTSDWPALPLLVSVEPAQLAVDADPDLLAQLLINLLKNAGEAVAGAAGGRVTLRAEAVPGGRVAIEVVDNGPGIDPGMQQDIFLPFFSTKKDGTGVGLSLARQIALAHGGALTCAPGPTAGSCFRLLL